MFRMLYDFFLNYFHVFVTYKEMRLKLKINKDHLLLKNDKGYKYIFKYFDIKSFGIVGRSYRFVLLDDTQYELITPYPDKVYNKIYKNCVKLSEHIPTANVINNNLLDGMIYNEDNETSLLIPMGELINNT